MRFPFGWQTISDLMRLLWPSLFYRTMIKDQNTKHKMSKDDQKKKKKKKRTTLLIDRDRKRQRERVRAEWKNKLNL